MLLAKNNSPFWFINFPLIKFIEGDPIKSRTVTTNLKKITNALGGSFQHEVDSERRDELLVMVGAMSSDGFTARMQQFDKDRTLVVCGDRPTIQLTAIEQGVRGLVITGGFDLSSGLAELAKARGVSVLLSPFDTVNTTTRIRSSQFIDPAVDRQVVTLPAKMRVSEARSIVERSKQPVFPVVGDDGLLAGISFKSDVINPPRPKLVLVDHNELTQAVAGIEEADVIDGVGARNATVEKDYLSHIKRHHSFGQACAKALRCGPDRPRNIRR